MEMFEVEPTAEERANGWTAESLTAYLAEREKGAAGKINFEAGFRERAKPVSQNSRYRVLKWRR